MQFPFPRRSLNRTWTLETDDANTIIWKLLISPTGILVGEERDIEAKTASLFAVDVLSGKTLWRHITLDEPWWFGSEKATEDTLYVQTFRKPDLPEPKGIIAIDLQSGVKRWHQPEYSFMFAGKDKVFAARQGFSHRDYFSLDKMTGEIVDEFGEDSSSMQIFRDPDSDLDPNSHNANPLRNDDPAREMFYDAVEAAEIRGPVEYLEFKDYHIFCYHARSREDADAMLKNMLTNELIVLGKKNGKLLFRETIHRETPFPLPDNFFVTHDTLIYVKEKRELVGVKLV